MSNNIKIRKVEKIITKIITFEEAIIVAGQLKCSNEINIKTLTLKFIKTIWTLKKMQKNTKTSNKLTKTEIKELYTQTTESEL